MNAPQLYWHLFPKVFSPLGTKKEMTKMTLFHKSNIKNI